MNIANTFISWYHQNKRDLPWRDTKNPYNIWLSEIILQQTRVNQGLQYYYRFIEQFPNVFSMADASEEEILKLWQGLGYYSRARNLHHTAQMVVKECGGAFPSTYAGLLKLKGIGEYTAAAIASICFNEVVPVVDGNVARVLGRLYAINDPVNSTKGFKVLKGIAGELILQDDPATFNQAIMEFGALQCKPVNPECSSCPLNNKCEALHQKRVNELPVKVALTKVKDVFIQYFVIVFGSGNKNYLLLNKRTSPGIWKNLYDFPSFESEQKVSLEDLLKSNLIAPFLDTGSQIEGISPEYTHKLSHRLIHAQFVKLRMSKKPKNNSSYLMAPLSSVGQYPVPRLIEQYLRDAGII